MAPSANELLARRGRPVYGGGEVKVSFSKGTLPLERLKDETSGTLYETDGGEIRLKVQIPSPTGRGSDIMTFRVSDPDANIFTRRKSKQPHS